MFGTIARLQVKAGKLDALRAFGNEEVNDLPALRFQHVFQSDTNPNEVWLVVGFESREAYKSNAESPEQHERYLKFRELLNADPEWHDGELIDSMAR
jgi:quinol monooxygenase YgiN